MNTCAQFGTSGERSGILLRETGHFAYKCPTVVPSSLKSTASPLVIISLKTLQLLAIIGLASITIQM